MNKEFRDICISECIRPLVEEIRSELAEKYNVEGGENYKYKGLCNEASEMIVKRLPGKLKYLPNLKVESGTIHGEQKHLPTIQTKYWWMQHTWVKCILKEFSTRKGSVVKSLTLYIDATCSQFQDLYDDIPDYYISTKPPKWFYPDRNNPAWNNKITGGLNQKIFLPVKYRGEIYKEGIIEYIQYNIWGKISQFIWENIPRYEYHQI